MNSEDVNLSWTTDIAESSDECLSRPCKRRRFEEILNSIQPYYSQPIQGMSLLPVSFFEDAISECHELSQTKI